MSATTARICSLLLLLPLGLLALPAWAQAQAPADPSTEASPAQNPEAPKLATETAAMSPEEAALAASRARDLYCTDVAGVDVALQAHALGTVNAVWTQVIEVYEQSSESFLLYWRGVLAQCLDQEFRATQDLQGFLDAHQGDTALGPMVADAQRRLRVLQLQTGPRVQVSADRDNRRKAALVLGVSLASATAAVSGLALWQSSAMNATAAAMTEKQQTQDQQNAHYRDGVAQAQNATVLFSLAAGIAVGSVTSFIWSAAEGRSAKGPRRRPQLSLAAAPHPLGGASASLELAW